MCCHKLFKKLNQSKFGGIIMKAIVYTKYGSPDVLHLEEVEKPVPQDDEVLIKVQAASVNAYDWHFLTADVFLIRLMSGGLLKPKNTTLGADIAGQVEAVGSQVTQFKPGDEVFGTARNSSGGFAEYVCAHEKRLVLKPANVSPEEAAAVPMAALTALQGLRDEGRIRSGQKVLIEGASGGVGTFAIQIAKSFGAEVTAVCSTTKLDIARSIGADHVIDYTKDDFIKNGKRYDLILVANGSHSIYEYKRALNPDGICVISGGGEGSLAALIRDTILTIWISKTENKKIGSFMANINPKDLASMKELLETGMVKPVIDRRYKLSETAEALRYLGEGHAKGKVVITVEHNNKS
jgi:NADPH:quinone reductase-like Zn-dependent oxidoreductase